MLQYNEAHRQQIQTPITLPSISTVIGTCQVSLAIGARRDLAYNLSDSDLKSETTTHLPHLLPMHTRSYYIANRFISVDTSSIVSSNIHPLMPFHYDTGSLSPLGVRSINGSSPSAVPGLLCTIPDHDGDNGLASSRPGSCANKETQA
ncbi:hypothetical protein BASA50_006175 [Batrachochytrium salamandrivorans]|uniref:Uncharacterized protein n=1 Tax=Batrachochytrium salamandrivorans TaxID=1357716 RepID=A0ABQ8FAN8_9FUNG|nr:hypothetical protein BASA60_003258 [Batrachochytrium salamandrivorans]KAH6588669.1 hypothetical protein BASA61_005854 [Batrachochytrium salamandrivorans]KAH6594961.1 hypothetical protein BASA50_006175 [Batrachochytrium salamandrivorans]KAH9271909.1 hypothetical protein BASA83_005747 [Batrachochytrium salamandrivorans]